MSSIAVSLQVLTKEDPDRGVQFFRKTHQSYEQIGPSEMHLQEIVHLRKRAFQQCPTHLSCRHEDREAEKKLECERFYQDFFADFKFPSLP